MQSENLEFETVGEPLISAETVHSLFKTALLQNREIGSETEPASASIPCDGIQHHVVFNEARLEACRPEIEKMLDAVPEKFFIDETSDLSNILFTVGGSFLSLVYDRNGKQWADMHSTVEQFALLCCALGYAVFATPRNGWSFFPGSMPWILFRRRPLDRVAITDWKEKQKYVSRLIDVGRAGDQDKAVEAMRIIAAMIKGLI